MLRNQALLLVSSVIFGSAIAVPQQQQQEPLAEQQFKNIQSFKGVKASEIIPSMQFMSAALKVDCKYCHEADWSKDSKEEKRTTRDMIRMQNEINEKNFGGHPEVTCATCHAGNAHPINLTPTEGLGVRTRRDNKVSAADVLAAYEKAVGTNPAPVISGLRLEGTSSNRGKNGKVEGIYSGEKFRLVVTGTGWVEKQGFNGTDPWMTFEKGVQAFPMEHAHQFLNERKIYLGPSTLPKLENPSGGTAMLDGKPHSVVTGYVKGNEKVRASLFFDNKTGLLSRTAFYYTTILGTIAQINDYSNYKKVNGVMVPMKVAIHSAETDQVLAFTKSTVLPKIDPETFDPRK
ncbi:MAG: photosynthetic reaction center cytochrome c subunit family protein [Fimbriimonas sp.]